MPLHPLPPQSPGLRTHLGLEKSWGRRALPCVAHVGMSQLGSPTFLHAGLPTWLGWQQVCLPMQVCGGRRKEGGKNQPMALPGQDAGDGRHRNI